MRRYGTFFAAVVVVVVAFFIGRLSVKPLDGNPVGYHLHGLAKLDQKAVNLTSCSDAKPCNMNFDVYFNPSGAPANSGSCGSSSSCFSFHNLPKDGMGAQMTVTIDEATSSGYTNSVYASGAVTGS
ncbi:MAG: hypothetical protein JO190_13105 [Candidatus Eremiobacteraeota bacterium]|nr:hypothetical protein [Candidatus Eremiobacteraeota bacterium]MBV8498545.1 hypothetical protein [Candidatus Eremiobacteraeota bacterium]